MDASTIWLLWIMRLSICYTNIYLSSCFWFFWVYTRQWIAGSHGLPWQLIWLRIHLKCRRPRFNSWVRNIPWRRERLPTPVFLGFPSGSVSKEYACNVGDLGLIPESERSPGGGYGNRLQYPWLENPMDRGAWRATVHGVTEVDRNERLQHSRADGNSILHFWSTILKTSDSDCSLLS